MRAAAFMVTLAAATTALATPAAAPVSWADWVGDWDAKLKWDSCAADGEERPQLAIDAADGVMTLALRPAGGALPDLTLVGDADGWSGQQGDVSVRLKRTKADSVELAVELESGCAIRGTLTRASVGVASCDRLSAWARIEAACTKLARPPLENPARLARQRERWTKARGDARSTLSAQCTARSAKVEQELIDAGCAPNPDPEIGLRGAECQALRNATARVSRCTSVPFDLRTSLEREAIVLAAAAQGADKTALPIVESECRQARDRLVTIAKQAGCPP
jgi:hypothetical protein